ncbi:MAG: CBS domain-containing protein [Micromonosporaceae bacterium]|nr:CBS domain-containing protein [Micromonosporaceae bacterium]
MRARDIMSRPVHTVRPDTSIEEAAALLSGHGFAAAPVVGKHGDLVGIVGEGDLLRHRVPPDPTAHLRRDLPVPHGQRPRVVADVMTREVIAMPPDADVADIAEQMLDRNVRSIPIVDDGEVIGIVSRRDILRAVVRTDDVIGMEAQHRLDEYAAGQHRWTVTVAEGVVHVSGDFDDEVQRQIVTVLARTVPGVAEARVMQPA